MAVNPFEQDINPNQDSSLQTPQSGVQSQSNSNPFEQDITPYRSIENDHFNSGISGDPSTNTGVDYHSTALAAGDMARGVASAPLSIVDLAARLPTWAMRTATGNTDSYPYPPSLNDALQNKLTEAGLPVPHNDTEAYTSAALRNWMFGPAGMAAGPAVRAVQQFNPSGNDNMSVGGRDIGLSPNDVAAGGIGLLTGGVSPTRGMALSAAKGTDAARLADIAMKNNIPVSPSDVAPGSMGELMRFYSSSPASGAGGRQAAQQSGLTTMANKAMGVEGDQLTTPTMGANSDRLGKVFEDFGKNNNVNQAAGSDLLTNIGNAANKWVNYDPTTITLLNKQIDNTILPRMNQDMSIDGPNWHLMYKDIGEKLRSTDDPELSSGLQSMRKAVSGAMRQSLPPEQYAPFDTANSQWRAMLALEPAAKKAVGSGDVDPSALMAGANRIYPNTIYNDSNAVPQAAQVGQFLKNAWGNQDAAKTGLRYTPFDIGQGASWIGSPLWALMNRTTNAAINPGELSAPYLAQFYNAGQGTAEVTPQVLTQAPEEDQIPHITIRPRQR